MKDDQGYPELSGALSGLERIERAAGGRWRHAVAEGGQRGWGYYFPYLLSRNRPGNSAVLLGEEAGSQCAYLWRLRRGRPRLDVYLAPTPATGTAAARCIERANDYNGDRSARIMRIDAADAAAIRDAGGLDVRRRKLQYLYAPASYGELRGRKFYTIRRNVARVSSRPDVEVVPYAPSLAGGCRELLDRWRRRYRRLHGSAGGIGTSRRAVALAGRVPETVLRGEVVLLDGSVAAFAFGGEIRPGIGCIFETKSDNEVPGLAYFHRYRFLSRLADCERVNDGSDTGRSGLRQLKDSFRPVEMHAEYRAAQC